MTGTLAHAAAKPHQASALRISQPRDRDETEAERAADVVTGGGTVAGWSFCAVDASPPPPAEPPVQRAPASGHSVVPADVDAAMHAPGRPLEPAARRSMGLGFGYDFSQVRVHDDNRAAAAAAQIDAAAFTVGTDIFFGSGRYDPVSREGRRLVAHELAHVVQQSRSPHAGRGVSRLQRKVVVSGNTWTTKERKGFLARHKWVNAALAKAVLDDMADAGDPFDFTDEPELTSEIVKRVSTTSHMIESQQPVPGTLLTAFGYPFNPPAQLYGPRVNYDARDLWTPPPPDNYAQRTDKAKNKAMLALPRHERHTIYGDMGPGYSWTLTGGGKKDTYSAIAFLFKPQQPHKRTLLHCDYLISIVNFLSLADSIGKQEFNKRITAWGPDRIRLRFDGFTDLHKTVFEAIAGTGAWQAKPGLGSAQRVSPSTESDLVIGDHVVFFNHVAYDLINKRVGNAWRLENAVLIGRTPKVDIFLGHGSGRKTAPEMRAKLAEEFNDVARQALALTVRAGSKDKASAAGARSTLTTKFPKVVERADGWRIVGDGELCKTTKVDMKLALIKPDDVIGLKDPCDPKKLSPVERPIESAKGTP